MTYDLSQFHQVFFDESAEHLEAMESILLKLDPGAPEQEDLNAIFRAAHSIKGGAGTFGFTDIAAVTHVAETLLDRLRRQELALETTMVDALLEASDVIKAQLAAHQAGQSSDPAAADAVRARLEAVSRGGSVGAVKVDKTPSPSSKTSRRFSVRFEAPTDDPGVASLIAELRSLGEVEVAQPAKGRGRRKGNLQAWELRVTTTADEAELRGLLEFVLPAEAVVIERLGESEVVSADAEAAGDATSGVAKEQSDATSAEPDVGYGFFEPLPVLVESKDESFGFFDDAPGMPTGEPPSSVGRRATDQVDVKEGRAGRRDSDKVVVAPAAQDASSIRVSVEKVDQLINLMGELVITQSMLVQTAERADPALYEALYSGIAQLQRNSRDLQEAVMSIRMMPIAFVFSRYPRLVRDLASKLGKQVDLKLVGEHTELDKGVIEKIADPLTHLVRNSLDHGLENTEDREQNGKTAKGTITLSAFHQGGNIVIEVADDGRGLDREKILAKAKSRGMPVSDDMADADVFALIFEAGLSTAEQVTDVSGRGVGMDVVRKNILALGGRVEIRSQPGKGCTVSIRLPLTLAILDGMSVAVGNEMYIVPLGFIEESLQPAASDIRTIAGKGVVMQVRGEYLSVLRLHQAMGIQPKVTEFHKGIMVILEAEGVRIAMFVDGLVGQHQVVIKSIESNYRRVKGISAATIMGDGKVAMILDVGQLVRMATEKPEALRAA